VEQAKTHLNSGDNTSSKSEARCDCPFYSGVGARLGRPREITLPDHRGRPRPPGQQPRPSRAELYTPVGELSGCVPLTKRSAEGRIRMPDLSIQWRRTHIMSYKIQASQATRW